jgi:hypothetical protein
VPRDISYSNGMTVKNAVIVVWDDWHTERTGESVYRNGREVKLSAGTVKQ